MTTSERRPGATIVRHAVEDLELVLHRGYWPSGREVERWERRELERTIRELRRQRRRG